ncbi:MAG: class I SAM-dependent methyltransferase [Candidatus Saganbacteria bacterium]|nr:class I SAM-dependent methyltransferase [Candidatus Saganbacteria bacterium]
MDKAAQIAYFEGLLAEHGANYLALDWNSPDSQRLRFKVLKELFIYGKKAAGISLLDLGCGLGDLYGWLKADGTLKRNRIGYTGYDISPGLIAEAKKKYPDGKFEVRDILEDRHAPKFDYIFCCGVFNIRTTDRLDHLDFVKEMLFRLYDLAVCGVGVNFLSEGGLPLAGQADAGAGRYFFFNPEEILDYSRFVATRYILRHDYHPGDFTVYLLK